MQLVKQVQFTYVIRFWSIQLNHIEELLLNLWHNHLCC